MRKIVGRNACAIVGDTNRCLSGARNQTETKLCAMTVPEHILAKVVYDTLVGIFSPVEPGYNTGEMDVSIVCTQMMLEA